MDTQKDEVVVTSTIVPGKKKETKKYILIGIVAFILAVVAFYFLYYIKTPVYSLYEIRTAVQTKNILLLEERADLKSVYSNAFDDYVAVSLEDLTTSNPLAAVMAKFIKPTVVDTLVEKTKSSVKNGEFSKDKKEVETDKETTKNKPAKEVPTKENPKDENSKITNFKLSGVKQTEILGENAVVSAEVLDKRSNKTIIIDLKMKKLSDGTWQLVKINNFKEILKELNFPSFNELVK